MKKNRTDKQILNDLRKMYEHKAYKLGEDVPETFKEFLDRSEQLAEYEGVSIKEAAKQRLNKIGYTSYEERVHHNLVNTLKEEGMVSRLYRMGGKTAFNSTSFDSKETNRIINGESYHSTGSYKMGNVIVTFLSADNNSSTQYIMFSNGNTTWLQARKGRKI